MSEEGGGGEVGGEERDVMKSGCGVIIIHRCINTLKDALLLHFVAFLSQSNAKHLAKALAYFSG